jgi:ABC-type phosphate/phosphonate transport system substrate-binding protein
MLSFAHDINLNFPAFDPSWGDFFGESQCRARAYFDLKRLTDDLFAGTPTAAYLPAANDYFLRDDKCYRGIASALTGKGAQTMRSVLVVSQTNPITSLDELKGKRLGRINGYCTSSYFAAAIFLQRHGYCIKDFFAEIRDVGAWQKQIDAVVAGTVDVTMVDADSWASLPENATTTRVLGEVDQLPTPIVIARTDAPVSFVDDLKQHLLSEPRNEDELFSGFVDYDEATDTRFLSDAALAFAA